MLKCVRKSTVLQLDGEGCAFAFLTINSDGTAMLQNNLAAETETDAGTRGLGSEERDESMAEDIGRHTAAIVLYTDLAITVDFDFYLCSTTLVGILDKIDEHLFCLGTVSRQ